MKTKITKKDLLVQGPLYFAALFCLSVILWDGLTHGYPAPPEKVHPVAMEEKSITIEQFLKSIEEATKVQANRPSEWSRCSKYPNIQGAFRSVCTDCHVVPSMEIKESDPDAWRSYPNYRTQVLEDEQGQYGYLRIESINSDPVKQSLEYFEQHGIERVVVELHSPGGSLFDGWRIYGLLMTYPGKVTTRCYGLAASAGFLVWLAGEERECTPYTILMHHELWTFQMFSVKTPSSAEQESSELRYLQDVATRLVASRCNLTPDEVNEKVKQKNWWIDGKDAFDFGFATKLLE